MTDARPTGPLPAADAAPQRAAAGSAPHRPGAPAEPEQPAAGAEPEQPAPPMDPHARTALVIGRIAVFTCWIPFVNIATGIAALVGLALGVRALRRTTPRDIGPSRRAASWGIAFCAAAILVALAATLALIDVLAGYELPAPPG